MSKKMTGYESEIPREYFACETNATGSLRRLCHQIKTIIPEYSPSLICTVEDTKKKNSQLDISYIIGLPLTINVSKNDRH